MCVWRSDEDSQEWILPFRRVSSETQTQATRLEDKDFSLHTGPLPQHAIGQQLKDINADSDLKLLMG